MLVSVLWRDVCSRPRPVLEQRTDGKLLNFLMKGLANLYFSMKKLFVYTYFTYNHRYLKYTTHRKQVQASFILPSGLYKLYFDLENSVKIIEFRGP